eukprot:760240-Hanusia_phi.AAC.2
MESQQEEHELPSCSSALDAFWFCLAPSCQLKKLYRDGVTDDCNSQQRYLELCLRLRWKKLNARDDTPEAKVSFLQLSANTYHCAQKENIGGNAFSEHQVNRRTCLEIQANRERRRCTGRFFSGLVQSKRDEYGRNDIKDT